MTLADIVTQHFTIRHEGSISLLSPRTDEAEAWLSEHADSPSMWGRAIVVEPRYLDDLLTAAAMDLA